MFLAEDRLLNLGIFCTEKARYTLKFCPDALAKVDAVDDYMEFLNQRRRWNNSTWYSLEFVMRNYEFHLEGIISQF